MEQLETARLILRPFTEADAADLYEYAKDSRVGPVTGWPPHKNIEESRRILKMFMDGGEVLAIVWKETGKVIGSIGLHRRDPEEETKDLPHREVGCCLSPAYWERGIMPEAVAECLRYGFEDLGLALVWYAFYDGNDRSRRVAEKCGFSHRFTRTDCVELMGEERTAHYYALTREEWQAR